VGRRQATAGGRRRAWRLGRVVARRVPARRSQRGWASGGRASWGPGGAGRAARGQLVARGNASDERWATLQRNREGEAGGRRQ
jgi:hypothetical protein